LNGLNLDVDLIIHLLSNETEYQVIKEHHNVMNAIKLIYTINNSGIIVLLASMISVMNVQLIRHKRHNFLYINVLLKSKITL